LIEAGRDTDAYQRFHRTLIRETPTLWSITECWSIASGNDEEAVDNWQRAVDVDPVQSNAQLYL
jgi:hypothetical protein